MKEWEKLVQNSPKILLQNNEDEKIKAQKLILKTCFKLKKTGNFSLLKILAKNPKRWGLYRPNQKLAVRLSCQPDRLTGRPPGRPPTVKNPTVGKSRSTSRSTQTNREHCSQIRSTARSTGQLPV